MALPKSITTEELEAVLQGFTRSSFVSFTGLTEPDMRTRKNPFCSQEGRSWISHVRKVSICSGAMINCSYNRIVDARRLREHAESAAKPPLESRQTNPRAWGSHREDGPLVEHETAAGESRLYLHVIIQRRTDHFFDNRTGKRIPERELAGWLNPRDSGYRHQGLRNPVIVKDFQLCNVAELTISRRRYTIAPAASELQTYLPTKRPATATKARPKRNRKYQPAKGAS